jgi:Rod binding domain-containing protein
LSAPIAPAARGFPLSPQIERGPGARANAMTAPQTPSLRAPTVDRTKVDPKIIEAADGLETMFMDYLMKTMRETVPKNDMDLENGATAIYRGMLDQEYAQKAVKAGGVGLSDTIIAYLAPESYNLSKGQMTAPKAVPKDASQVQPTRVSNPRTGGTDESDQ